MKTKSITIPIFVPNSGCPNRCVFCNQKISTSTVLMPDQDYIRQKIKKYLFRLKPDVTHIEVGFFGGSFTGINKELQVSMLSAANEFVKSGEINGIRLSTRPDMINTDILEILKKYGVTTIELGVQSFSDEALKLSGRGHTSEDVFSAVDLIKKNNLNFVIQLMPGLPGSTAPDDINSAETAADLNPQSARIYPVVVLKNTMLERLYNEQKYFPLSFESAVNICADMHQLFESKKISVIRIGIHPVSEEEVKNIIAGPYHPSFGFFVKSEIKKRIIENELIKYTYKKNISSAVNKNIEIIIPDFEKEEYIGSRKKNIKYLEDKFGLKIKYSFHNNSNIRISGND